jgi:hypothetical protein
MLFSLGVVVFIVHDSQWKSSANGRRNILNTAADHGKSVTIDKHTSQPCLALIARNQQAFSKI